MAKGNVGKAIAPPSGERDVSVRKISNGYIVRESFSARGQYKSKETFTKTAPKVVIKGK